ncbi:hypothetical protein ABZS88_11410 [Streptomyces sp. NPDC005480]|uniref:hypothetical protein n=1 Tax=Streptomyces sp. NPDC005480 TaxID=3154880 RepID=UPI0033B4BEC2
MKVRMKVQISGTRNGQEWPAKGGEVELPDDEGAQLCASGLAEPLTDTAEPETATAPDAEKRPARSRKGA